MSFGSLGHGYLPCDGYQVPRSHQTVVDATALEGGRGERYKVVGGDEAWWVSTLVTRIEHVFWQFFL